MKTFSQLAAHTTTPLIMTGLLLSLSMPAFAQTDGFRHGPGMMWGGGWGGMIVGPLMMLLFIVVAAVLVVFVVRWLGGTGGGYHGPQSGREGLASTPLGILQERFARGEIEREEYEDRRRVLGE